MYGFIWIVNVNFLTNDSCLSSFMYEHETLCINDHESDVNYTFYHNKG